MDLRHLRYFVAAAEVLHFGRAARRLGIAQPPLSQQIQRLETELETLLLQRTRRRVRLTEAGEVLLREARAILAHSDRAVHLTQRVGRGETGQLSVAFVPWADFTDVPDMIRTFGERHPEVELALDQLTVPELLLALRDGRIHIGILRPPVNNGGLVTEPLVSEPLIVIFPKGHRFERYRQVPWRRLADQPYIALTAQRAPAFQAVVAHACRDAGITLRIRHEADHPQTVLALVAAGVGVSLVPASVGDGTRTGIDHRGLRPVGPALETHLAWRRNSKSPLVEAFLHVVRELRGAARRRARPA